jgi:hypothetical protein
MTSSQKNRVRLSVEALERRDAPATLTISPPRWVDPIVKEITASARPGLATTEVNGGGVVQWSLDGAPVRAVESAAHSHARPFHLEESGTAVINPDGTISGSASGKATHLGTFTLHDTSSIVGAEVTPDGLILQIVGQAELVAANGDKLYASLSGSVNMTTGEAALTFEWTGGDGRFTDASGATVWQLTLNPDLSYVAVADGVINY